jgi:hypothetical protein
MAPTKVESGWLLTKKRSKNNTKINYNRLARNVMLTEIPAKGIS